MHVEDEDKAKDNKSPSIFGFKRRVGKNWYDFWNPDKSKDIKVDFYVIS